MKNSFFVFAALAIHFQLSAQKIEAISLEAGEKVIQGIQKETSNENSTGVYGEGFLGLWGKATGNAGYGVLGQASGPSNFGVLGHATGQFGRGVYGESLGASGVGIEGVASGLTGKGVFGISEGTNGTGVFGSASGNIGNGVFGESSGDNGRGVSGIAFGTFGRGMSGYSSGDEGVGVEGEADGSVGVGVLGNAYGENGTGVAGFANGEFGFGMNARSTGELGIGILGEAEGESGIAVRGIANGANAYGLDGMSEFGIGVRAVSSTNTALFATSNTGYAAHLQGTVFAEGELELLGPGATSPVTITQNKLGGSSTFEVMTADGSQDQTTRLLIRGANDFADVEFYSGGSGDETLNLIIEGTNGNIGMGVSAPQEKLDVNGNARFRMVGSSPFLSNLNLTPSGALTTHTSDRRLKENISGIENALALTLALRGVSYNWIEDQYKEPRIGFIAQEVEEILPEVVFTNPVDGYKGVRYDEITAVLVESIKQQQDMILSQQAEIDKLNQKLSDLIESLQEPPEIQSKPEQR